MVDNELGYITELSPTDVLFGRGSGPNDHEGNIRFRQLVAERKQEYLATNHRQTKATIAREIVNTILEERGRFLKKVEHFEARRLGIPKGVDAWIMVDDDTVMEKAKQALRQNTNKGPRGNSPSRGGQSPTGGNTPVRGLSPVRGQVSPIPCASSPVRRHPHQMRTFDDLEPLPLGMNSAAELASARAAVNVQPFAGMTPQQQQLAIQQQVQLQVQQQQQQIQAAQMATLGAVAGLDPSALGWGGSDHNSFDPDVVAQLAAAQGDWAQGGSNHGALLAGQQAMVNNNAQMGGWGAQQQQNMAPPQPRVPVQFSNNDINGWSGNSEHTLQSGTSGLRGDNDDKRRRQSLHMEDLMDSFSQLNAGAGFSTEAKLQESTDTMGTIEPIGGFGDSTSMSVTSFSSSTFSLFKSAMGESTEDMPFSRGVSRSSSINEPRGDVDASMQSFQSMGSLGNLSEVWGSRGMSLLDRLVQEERERANAEGGGNGGEIAEAPRPVRLMEDEFDHLNSLRPSSLSVMKAAYDRNRQSVDPNQTQDES